MRIFKKTFLPRDWAWPGPITLYSFDFENICSYSQWQSEGISTHLRSFQWQSEEVFILSVNKSQWHVRDMSTFQVMTLKSNVITRGLVRPSQNKSHTLWLVWRTPSSTLTIVSSRDSVKVGANCRHLLLSPFPKGKVRWWEHKISTWQRISYKITNLDHPFHFTRTCYL